MKHLYIIGNGFDIHHKINSSYSNFRDWMENYYPSILEMSKMFMVIVMLTGGLILKII